MESYEYLSSQDDDGAVIVTQSRIRRGEYSFRVEHDGVDARELLEKHESEADPQGQEDNPIPQMLQVHRFTLRDLQLSLHLVQFPLIKPQRERCKK